MNLQTIPLKFYAHIKKDILLLVKRKKYLYLSLAIPFVIAIIFLFMLNPSKTGIKVEVCDYDQSEYSAQISDLEGFVVKFLPTEKCYEQLISNIKSGKTHLGIEIPKGFSENLINSQPGKLTIYYDNTDIAFSNLISWKVDVSLNNYKRKIVDEFNQEIKTKVASLRSNLDVALGLSSIDPINKRLKLIDADLKKVENTPTDFLMNPVWTEKVSIYEEKFSKDSGIAFIFPIIAMFIVLMLSSTSLIYDKKTNFITRVKASTSPGLYLIAKMVFFFIVTFTQFLIILIIFLLYGASYNFSFGSMIEMLIIVSVMNSLLGMIIGLISDNEGIAILFSLMVSFPLMLMSGVFFPPQTMPVFFQTISKLMPLSYQISIVKSTLLFDQTLTNEWVLPLVVLFVVVHYMLKTRQ